MTVTELGREGPESAAIAGWRRVIPLAGVSNLRDLGGYRSTDGRSVRRGLVYRSAALNEITDDDGEAFLALGIRTICDFRGPQEREAAPYRRPPGCRAVVHELDIVSATGPAIRELMRSPEASPTAYRMLLIDAYRSFVRDHSERYRALFAQLLDAAAYPLLFHCAAGKDRTGLAAALLLSALGVDRSTVEEDYLLTNQHWHGASPTARAAPPALAATIVKADRLYLEAAFSTIVEDHATIEDFLEHRLGVGASERETLRRQLLE